MPKHSSFGDKVLTPLFNGMSRIKCIGDGGKTMFYPAIFTPEKEGGFSVSFKDIPEALTCADTLEDAKEMAKYALITAMEFYFEGRRKVPLPSEAQKDELLIELPDSIFTKVLLLNEMVEQEISNADLARKINVKPQEVQRIVDLSHNTKIDTISKALQSLGKNLVISVA